MSVTVFAEQEDEEVIDDEPDEGAVFFPSGSDVKPAGSGIGGTSGHWKKVSAWR